MTQKECDARLTQAAGRTYLERAAVVWTIIMDQERREDKWRQVLSGTERDSKFGVPRDQIFEIEPGLDRAMARDRFAAALRSALNKIKDQAHPQLFVVIDSHGGYENFATHRDHSAQEWEIQYDEVSQLVQQAVNAVAEIKSKLQINLCVDACHAFSSFAHFQRIDVPTHFIGAAPADKVAYANEMLNPLQRLSRWATLHLGHAPSVQDVIRLQKLLEPRQKVSDSNIALNDWTADELEHLVNIVDESEALTNAILKFCEISSERCLAWAKNRASNQNDFQAPFAKRVLKYGLQNQFQKKSKEASSVNNILRAGLWLEMLSDVSHLNAVELASELMDSQYIPTRTHITYLDALIGVNLGDDSHADLGFYHQYVMALQNTTDRKQAVREAYRHVTSYVSSKGPATREMVRKENKYFDLTFNEVMESQFRHSDFLQMDRAAQERATTFARERNCGFEEAP